MSWNEGVYLVAYTLAALVFTGVARHLLPHDPHRGRIVLLLGFGYLLGMVYAAHAAYFAVVERTMVNLGALRFGTWLEEHPEAIAEYDLVRIGWRLLRCSSGGLWGGPLFVVAWLCAVALALPRPLSYKHAALDAGAVALPLALSLCKVGCFAVGCCFGIAHDSAFALAFRWTRSDHPCYDTPCIPTQLVDLLAYAAVGAALWSCHRRQLQRGRLLAWLLILLGSVRFGSELLRGDGVAPAVANLSSAQLFAAVGVLFGVGLLIPGPVDAVLARTASESRTGGALPERGATLPEWLWIGLLLGAATEVAVAVFPALFGPGLVLALLRRDPVAALHRGCGLSLGLLWHASLLAPSLAWFVAVASAAGLGLLCALRLAISAGASGHLPRDRRWGLTDQGRMPG